MHTSEHEHIKEGKERILLLLLLYIACSSIFYCPRFTGDHLLLFVSSGIHGPHQTSLPVLLGRVAATFGGLGRLPTHVTCMRCMHQKASYALYAKTQLRKRLHTMHTRRQFGSGVGLRARKCMHLRMHTDCIQSAYK